MTAKHWQPTRRATLALCLAASWLAAAPAQAQADNWPAKPIRIVVGFPAGSFTDTIARAVSDQVVFLEKGKLIEQAPPEEFFLRPRSERVRQFLQTVRK